MVKQKMSLDQERDIEDSDDSEDEDYVYTGGEDLPSEEDSDGEPEDDIQYEEDTPKHGHKRKNTQKSKTNKKICRKEKETTEDQVLSEENGQPTKLCEEDEKKKTDSLWEDFLKDTGSRLPTEQHSSGTSINESNSKKNISGEIKTESKNGDKQNVLVTVTKVFQFAGEEVKLTKEVPADSVEAQISSSQNKPSTEKDNESLRMNVTSKGYNKSDRGLSSVLNQIGKKNKIGTLEKSKIDWEKFKKSEGLEEDIQVHNRGKAGYLERQDFLQRTDLRQFEIEKEMRTRSRSNR